MGEGGIWDSKGPFSKGGTPDGFVQPKVWLATDPDGKGYLFQSKPSRLKPKKVYYTERGTEMCVKKDCWGVIDSVDDSQLFVGRDWFTQTWKDEPKWVHVTQLNPVT